MQAAPPNELAQPYRAELREAALDHARLDAQRLAGKDVDEGEIERLTGVMRELEQAITNIEEGSDEPAG